jgi:hybrid cluster-associated redox disulfide protein
MSKINEDMIIADVLKMDSETAPILFEHGLHCLGCMHATGESLKDACAVHGIDVEALVADLNKYFEDKQ